MEPSRSYRELLRTTADLYGNTTAVRSFDGSASLRSNRSSSSKLGTLVAIHPERNRRRTVFTPLRGPRTSLTPPSRPLAKKNSTKLLRIHYGFTVSVRPPYNNRRASMHLHSRAFGQRHGCTIKGPVPLSRINLRMTHWSICWWPRMKGSRQFYGRPVRSTDVFNDSKLQLRCYTAWAL